MPGDIYVLSDGKADSIGMKGFRHKTEKKKEEIQWNKILIVVACVAFAVFMIFSMFGMSWLNIFSQAKPGNTAVLDYTFYDAENRPVVTTDQVYFQNAHEQNTVTLLASQMPVRVNITTDEDLVPIQVVNPYNQYGLIDFGLFGPEIDAMSMGAVGMKIGESKTMTLPWAGQMTRTMTDEQFAKIAGEVYADAKVGDQVPIAFSETPQIVVDDNATPSTYLRTSTVVDRSNGNISLNYGYPSLQITLSQLNS